MANTVTHDEENRRYVISVDGEEAGFTAYAPLGESLEFNHTVVDPKFQGQGLSKELITAAMDDVRERGKKIYPACSAVYGFMVKNPDYRDLLA